MVEPRSIVHLDADAFFASVEQAADSHLRGKPIAVGGEKRGIITSASYEARKFGIYTPMPTVLARRLCPKLILLPGDFEKYELFSRLMFSYAYDFTPDVEVGSIDEGYFDLSGARKPARGIAETVRHAIRQALRLSVSEGIAANKLVSQIASKLKKPSAFEFVPHGGEAQFLSPLANKWLPGIGPKAAGRLNAAGLVRIGQIAQTPIDLLGLLVGSQAPQLRNFSRGIDERPVIPVRAPAKSYGEQETFAADTTDEEFLDATLRRMADKLMAKVREGAKSIRTLTVKVRYNDMDEQQASESLAEPTDLETEIYSKTSALLRKAWQRRVSLRLISLKLSNVYNGCFSTGLALDIPSQKLAAQQRLAEAADLLRQKYGRAALLRGHDFILRKENPGPRVPKPGTPQFHKRLAASLPLPKGEGRGEGKPNRQLAPSPGTNNNPQTPSNLYNLAVVQRQRIGNSFTRVAASPGPELRFRIEPKPPSHHSSSVVHHPTTRFTHHPSRITHIPLNLHSYYSFLDSTLSIKAIIELAQRHELPAIALTDKNNLHGAVEFAQAAAAAGIKPIIGAELNWHGHRLCLYVQNQTGYYNLCRILSQDPAGNPKSEKVASDGFSSLVALHPSPSATNGLLALSPSPALAEFFPDCFYLEINSAETFEKYHNSITPPPHQSINPSTRQSSLPALASFPIHYALPGDRWKYNVVQSIRTLTLLRQPHPEKRLDGAYHFRPAAEMQRLFGAHPELLAHSLELAERCSFNFTFDKPQFPAYPTPDGSPPAVFLRRRVMEGLQRCYPKNHARLKPQVEQELAIITEVGYEEYFLIMWDILQECGRRGIEWITRGSAADSLACYCLEISSVCPIRFDLYFRRFLNKERMALNKLPDIDVDFPHDRKDDVIDLLFEKYGPSRAAVVGGFSTFQSRSAFAEVAKVLGVSEYQVRRLTERLPHFSRPSDLTEAVAGSLECRDLPLAEEPYSTALQMAHFLDGFPRYPKMHPCGVVLSRQLMHEITPTFTSAKGYPTTHFDMDSIEAVGLVKMDVLAQGGLAVMRDVLESVQSPRSKVQSTNSPHPGPLPKGEGEPLPVSPEIPTASFAQALATILPLPKGEGRGEGNLTSKLPSPPNTGTVSDFGLPSPAGPFDDPRVWQLISSGNARAVHHIESPAMISLCKMCNVRDIDILIAIVSVIRPGAANESKKMEFARRYQGLSPVHCPHPSLERCLRSTYGLVVYEEHILQICEAFAGLPPGRADILRRALGKEKTDIIGQIQTEFADYARQRGRAEAEIAEVWELVTGFRGYAFCKAHSTAYGVEAYQSAWLKLHYPAEFMAAVLTNGKGFYSPLVYVLECHRLGIPLLPPSVNEPGPGFIVTGDERRVTGEKELKGLNRLNKLNEAGIQNSLDSIPLTPALSQRERETRILLTQPPLQKKIRVPVLLVKGLTQRTKEAILRERALGEFSSLGDFFLRVQPLPEEMEALIRVGAFDSFGQSRTAQYWQFKGIAEGRMQGAWRKSPIENQKSKIENHQPWLLPPGNLERLPSVPLCEPTRIERLRAEEELLGYPASGHPLELFPDIAWDTYCPIKRLGNYLGQQIVTCGLVIEQRLFHQVTGEPMKFITIADRTGIIETELFAQTYQSYGLNTIRYRVLEITATVEPFENGRGHTLRVLRAGKPRTKK
jgi:DNA polymerase III alpha subunit/nucleotidyltransferase/DNA polymerase involved in DNA repair